MLETFQSRGLFAGCSEPSATSGRHRMLCLSCTSNPQQLPLVKQGTGISAARFHHIVWTQALRLHACKGTASEAALLK